MGNLGTDTQRRSHVESDTSKNREKSMWMWRQRLDWCCHKLRSIWGYQCWKSPERILSQSMVLPTHWFWNPSIQNDERMFLLFFFFKLHSVWHCYSSPGKLIKYLHSLWTCVSLFVCFVYRGYYLLIWM